MTGVTDAIERALGASIARSTLAPWGSKNRTRHAVLADGRQVVVQEYADRDVAAARLSAAEQLAEPLRAHGVPVPTVLASDLAGPVAWGVFERLPGEPAYVACGDDLSGATFPAVARGMGRLARRMAELDPAGFDLPRRWTDASALRDTAKAWLADLEPHLSSADVTATRAVIDRLPELLAHRAGVVCHGDFGPQNVLVVEDRVTGLLDLEDARVADRLSDIAWWGWLVRAHTPAAFSRTWSGFLAAAGVDRRERTFADRVHALIVVRLLETADAFRRSAPEKHASWATRLARTLEWGGMPLA